MHLLLKASPGAVVNQCLTQLPALAVDSKGPSGLIQSSFLSSPVFGISPLPQEVLAPELCISLKAPGLFAGENKT